MITKPMKLSLALACAVLTACAPMKRPNAGAQAANAAAPRPADAVQVQVQVPPESPATARARWQREYREAFENMRTVAAADAFLKRYAKEDPDSLLPKVRDKRRLLQYREDYLRSTDVAGLQGFIARYQAWDPDGLVAKARKQKAVLIAAENQPKVVVQPTARPAQPPAKKTAEARDAQGREIVRGPVSGGFYSNVHIVSDSVGIAGEDISIMNSVIEAPVCIRTSGMGLRVQDSDLHCNVCIEYTGSMFMDNFLMGNRCSGIPATKPAF